MLILAKSSISNTEFTECNLKYVNFTSSKLNNCEVKESDLSDAFCNLFSEADEAGSITVYQYGIFKTPLKDLDFTTCILEGISVSTEGNELKGALVNVYQAAELAKLLGIVIKEDL